MTNQTADNKGGSIRMKEASKPLFFQLSWFQIIKYWLLFLGFIGLMVLYAYEFKYFENTFHIKRLVWFSLWIGTTIGAILAYYLLEIKGDLVTRIKTTLLIMLPFIAFSPLFGSLFNRVLSTRDFEVKDFEVFKVDA